MRPLYWAYKRSAFFHLRRLQLLLFFSLASWLPFVGSGIVVVGVLFQFVIQIYFPLSVINQFLGVLWSFLSLLVFTSLQFSSIALLHDLWKGQEFLVVKRFSLCRRRIVGRPKGLGSDVVDATLQLVVHCGCELLPMVMGITVCVLRLSFLRGLAWYFFTGVCAAMAIIALFALLHVCRLTFYFFTTGASTLVRWQRYGVSNVFAALGLCMWPADSRNHSRGKKVVQTLPAMVQAVYGDATSGAGRMEPAPRSEPSRCCPRGVCGSSSGPPPCFHCREQFNVCFACYRWGHHCVTGPRVGLIGTIMALVFWVFIASTVWQRPKIPMADDASGSSSTVVAAAVEAQLQDDVALLRGLAFAVALLVGVAILGASVACFACAKRMVRCANAVVACERRTSKCCHSCASFFGCSAAKCHFTSTLTFCYAVSLLLLPLFLGLSTQPRHDSATFAAFGWVFFAVALACAVLQVVFLCAAQRHDDVHQRRPGVVRAMLALSLLGAVVGIFTGGNTCQGPCLWLQVLSTAAVVLTLALVGWRVFILTSATGLPPQPTSPPAADLTASDAPRGGGSDETGQAVAANALGLGSASGIGQRRSFNSGSDSDSHGSAAGDASIEMSYVGPGSPSIPPPPPSRGSGWGSPSSLSLPQARLLSSLGLSPTGAGTGGVGLPGSTTGSGPPGQREPTTPSTRGALSPYRRVAQQQSKRSRFLPSASEGSSGGGNSGPGGLKGGMKAARRGGVVSQGGWDAIAATEGIGGAAGEDSAETKAIDNPLPAIAAIRRSSEAGGASLPPTPRRSSAQALLPPSAAAAAAHTLTTSSWFLLISITAGVVAVTLFSTALLGATLTHSPRVAPAVPRYFPLYSNFTNCQGPLPAAAVHAAAIAWCADPLSGTDAVSVAAQLQAVLADTAALTGQQWSGAVLAANGAIAAHSLAAERREALQQLLHDVSSQVSAANPSAQSDFAAALFFSSATNASVIVPIHQVRRLCPCTSHAALHPGFVVPTVRGAASDGKCFRHRC